MNEGRQTIYALASGAGPAGLAVIRISGRSAGPALRALSGCEPGRPRRAVRARFADAKGEAIDEGLALWFPEPHSYTGEDVLELHVHGGTAVVSAVCEALADLPDLRQAEPGEFTRRAFENGKLDLTQAEGIADLIAAETEAQRRQALRQLDGALGGLYSGWSERLMRSLAYLEAAIDFPDEDLPADVLTTAIALVAGVLDEMGPHLADERRGERLRGGFQIAILGAPNVGKSSLLNRLAQREAAIVSSRAGTTRDVVEVRLDLGGYPVTLADTAGLRAAADEIEAEGIRRARARAADADLKLVLFDAGRGSDWDPEALSLVDAATFVVVNKVDLANVSLPHELAERPIYALSALHGEGIAELLEALAVEIGSRFGGTGAPSLTRARHREAVVEAKTALERAVLALQQKGGEFVELPAEDVRLAVRALSRITGGYDIESILDIVFREFCIGK